MLHECCVCVGDEKIIPSAYTRYIMYRRGERASEGTERLKKTSGECLHASRTWNRLHSNYSSNYYVNKYGGGSGVGRGEGGMKRDFRFQHDATPPPQNDKWSDCDNIVGSQKRLMLEN
jgi:hypothetical protein